MITTLALTPALARGSQSGAHGVTRPTLKAIRCCCCRQARRLSRWDAEHKLTRLCQRCELRARQARAVVTQNYILFLAARGLCFKQIAARLDITIKTVGWHWGRLKDRTGIRELAGLVRHGIRKGFCPL